MEFQAKIFILNLPQPMDKNIPWRVDVPDGSLE
jgi:hypothetical protein